MGTDTQTLQDGQRLDKQWRGVNCVARALYDNIAETPDELAFRKGDVLTVLEQNTGGLEGWWLCSLRGRQGICPANRLRLVPRVYDTGNGEFTASTATINGLGSQHLHTYASSPMLNSSGGSRSSSSSSSSSSSAGGGSPGMGNRSHAKPGLLNAAVRAHQQKQLLQDHSHKVHQRQIFAFSPPDADTYDLPPAQPRPLVPRQDCYEVPRSHVPVVSADYDVPRRHHLPKAEPVDSQSCEYDVPRAAMDTYDSPRSLQDPQSPPTPILTSQYDVLPQTNRLSDRSSGVSTFSSGSSEGSTMSNMTSTSSESLSLSSALGIGANSSNPSGRSSRSSFDVCDGAGSYRTPQPSTELYDMPKTHNLIVEETYDVPPAAKEVPQGPVELYDVPKTVTAVKATPATAELYDTPPAARRTSDIDLHPTPQAPSVDPQETYDVPPTSNLVNRLNAMRIANETYDSPKAPAAVPSRWPADDVRPGTEQIRASLPLELDSALECLERLELEVTGSLSHMLGLWRYGGEGIQQTELQLRAMRLRSSLQELMDFAKGAIGNAVNLKSGDDQVIIRLSRLIRALQDANAIILKTTNSWSATMFTARRRTSPGGPDELDQLKACCLNLGHDARLVTEFIRSNGRLLFTSPAPEAAPTDDGAGRPLSSKTAVPVDDYDYVNLESKAKFDEENEEVKRTLPHDMKRGFDVLVRQSESVPVLPASNDKVSDNDRNVVEFYGSQAETYMVYLTNAIDAFILTIEHNQPPKVFVAYSKFVILNAHKLLCIGDTVHRNVGNAKLKAAVLERSNQLCQGLQTCVQNTKRAGREFPSVSAVQSMLDSVMAVSKLARSLKTCIVQAAGRT